MTPDVLQVEKWLVAAFMPPFKSLRPAAVAITLNSPGELSVMALCYF